MFEDADKIRNDLSFSELDSGWQEFILTNVLGIILLCTALDIKDTVVANVKNLKFQTDFDPSKISDSLTSKVLGEWIGPQQVKEMIKPNDQWDDTIKEAAKDNKEARTLAIELARSLLAKK